MDRHDVVLHDQNADWRSSVDPQALKQSTSLSRQREHVHLKLVRVENALAAAQNQVSQPRLRTYLKNVDDAYAEFNAVHSQLITIVPEEALREQEEIYIGFEERYNHLRSTIGDLLNAHDTHPATNQHSRLQPLSAPIFFDIDDYKSDWRKLCFKTFSDDYPNSTPGNLQEDFELPSHEESNVQVQENCEFTPQCSPFSSDPQPTSFNPREEYIQRSTSADLQPPKKKTRDLRQEPKNNLSDPRIVTYADQSQSMKCSSIPQAALSSTSGNLADSSETEIRQPAATDEKLGQPINGNATTQPINAFVNEDNQFRQRQPWVPPIKKELKELSCSQTS
ncbi:uncharacterized protein LOC134289557 [Aedes albopictus]|uniref:Uncharacterized protein n=1 Tax=Aedes albopictus TaxID=7160 RepID=A0ABM1ZUD7_AEDAL